MNKLVLVLCVGNVLLNVLTANIPGVCGWFVASLGYLRIVMEE